LACVAPQSLDIAAAAVACLGLCHQTAAATSLLRLSAMPQEHATAPTCHHHHHLLLLLALVAYWNLCDLPRPLLLLLLLLLQLVAVSHLG
jgi:hypothetical protein